MWVTSGLISRKVDYPPDITDNNKTKKYERTICQMYSIR